MVFRSKTLRPATQPNLSANLSSDGIGRVTGSSSVSRGRPFSGPVSGPSPGYLGFTSHSAVFKETEHNLSLLHGDKPEQSETDEAYQRPSILFCDLPSPIQRACLYVLEHLPLNLNEQAIFQDNTLEPEGWTHIAVVRIACSLQTNFSGAFEQGPEAVAEQICNNTTREFQDIHTSASAWMDQFCGSNIRWESLGLLFAYLERISDALDAHRRRHLAWSPEKPSAETSSACLGYCIDISRHLNEGNDLLVDLCRRRSTLESVTAGDASASCWDAHGLTISIMTFLGAHVQESDTPYKPSLCSENKRRVFAQVFNSDKFTVSFTGRPPLISRRYCSTPLPLDLPDEVLIANDETLMNAVNKLDPNGWNIEGGLYPATLVRARKLIANILDEIIEIALDSGSSVTVDQLLNIKARQLRMMAEFPASLAFDSEALFDPKCDIEALYARMSIYLGHLQNIFFLERLILRNGAPDEGDLLLTSFEMVQITVLFWSHKDRFAGARRNFEGLLMAFAAPGGGILCLELLQPSFSGTHPRDSRLSRSAIIQQLSLLVGFLDWVRPSAPNADLCADCKAIVQRVLDHHLNTPVGGNRALDNLDWNLVGPLDFNFELLDTFDWLRSDMGWGG